MSAKDVFRLVEYFNNISKGNRRWTVSFSDGNLVVKLVNLDTLEISTWKSLNRDTFRCMFLAAIQ